PFLAPGGRVGVVGHLGSPVGDVLAAVAVFGGLLPCFAGHEAGPEVLHLNPAVVDVELASDRMAAALQQPGEGVTVGGPAGVAGVHGSGRVGGHEFDVDPLPDTGVEACVALFTGFDHLL